MVMAHGAIKNGKPNRQHLAEEYVEYLKNTGRKNADTVSAHLRTFYKFIANTCSANVDEFIIKHLTTEQIISFKQYSFDSYYKNDIEKETISHRLIAVRGFLNYLFRMGILSAQITVPYTNMPATKISKKLEYPFHINEFLKAMARKGCSESSISKYKVHIVNFFSYVLQSCPPSSSDEDYIQVKQSQIEEYEHYLWRRVTDEEIKNSTAYRMLLSLKHYLKYLSDSNLSKLQYEIPKKIRVTNDRLNLYIPKEDTTKLIEVISKSSRLKERDLAIVLLLLDTGCRTCEVANMTVDDISLSESTVSLFSNKSGRRKMKLNPVVKSALSKYLSIRMMYSPKDQSVFLTQYGSSITAHEIARMVNRFNKAAFGEARHSPYAFRHTFVTNAIDNHINLKRISEVVGHRYLSSTIHYLHRGKKRLIQNTLPFDPTDKFL